MLRLFSSGYVLIKGGTFIIFFLNTLSFGYLLKNQNICHFKGGLRLFKGLYILFLPNVPGATFIQGGMFIPDSRVVLLTTFKHCVPLHNAAVVKAISQMLNALIFFYNIFFQILV